tara:strand:- start:66 stop:395 length:330 start_codon:yes stop_codon:yes gene_type:complete
MKTMERANKLCNAYVMFNHPESKISGFELTTCREISDHYGGTLIEEVKTAEEFLNTDEMGVEEPFYRVFAVYKPTYAKTRRAIADFYNIAEAIIFLEEFTGKQVEVHTF